MSAPLVASLFLALGAQLPADPAPSLPNEAPLARARAHYSALAFREALTELELALASPSVPREALLEILSLQGQAWAAVDRPQEAASALRALLSLCPHCPIPDALSPKMQAPWEQARAWAQEHGALTFTREPDLGDGRVRLRVSQDPLGLARRVRLHFKTGAGWEVVGGEWQEGTTSVSAPAAATDGFWVEWLGHNDAVLQTSGSPTSLLPLPAGHDRSLRVALLLPAAPPAQRRPLRLTAWGMWGGALAATGAGTVFFGRSLSAHSELENAPRDVSGRVVGLTQKDAFALDDQRRTHARTGSVLLGLGVALGAGGAAAYLWDQRLTVGAGPGHIAIGGSLR